MLSWFVGFRGDRCDKRQGGTAWRDSLTASEPSGGGKEGSLGEKQALTGHLRTASRVTTLQLIYSWRLLNK